MPTYNNAISSLDTGAIKNKMLALLLTLNGCKKR